MISLYFHWPFCQKKCPYCDFNSFVSTDVNHQEWCNAYLKVLKHYKNFLQNKKITSIFFGGGTPSLATPSMIKTILDFIKYEITDLPQDVEITLEANPTSVEVKKFQAFQKAGINRVSLGIQSFREENLAFLGRNHNLQDALIALEILRDTFNHYSFDLIYALPQQTLQLWEEELHTAIDLAKGHLSLYQLTIENNTKFGALKRSGLLSEIDENTAISMFKTTQALLKQAGFTRYEVSNFAKPGYESQHNLNYWLYKDYLGIGPGAHGRFTIDAQKVATQDIKDPQQWLQKVQLTGEGLSIKEVLSLEAIRLEKILMGMRTKYGIDKHLVGVDYSGLITQRLIKEINSKIIATNKGFLLLNNIIQQLSEIKT
jgi:putative oxygen-independent coproporphyrinogen III oxidase